MPALDRLFDIKTYVLTALAVVAFSYSVGHLFGQTIPAVVSSFFKYAGESVVLAAVFVFALAWLLKARPRAGRPGRYSVVVFDVYGAESRIDGLRTSFSTHDVAWSYMKNYKSEYPLHNFALVADGGPSQKRTIFRYI